MPLAIRRGGTSSDGLTSAWTSTSSGREPSIAARTTLPGARVASPTKRALASWTSTRPPWRISNTPASLVGAEAVLERPQRAVGPLALALELQDGVHEVLEHPRARERALLRHVADEQHGDVARLGEPRDPVGDLADLADGAGRAGEVGGVERLHGVDHAHLGPLRVERGDHRVEVGLGEHGHLERRAREPLRAQLDLRRALLAGDVEGAAAGALEVAERHRGQRRLADAGRAAEEHEAAGHEAAAEDAVELADARSAGGRCGRPGRRRGGRARRRGRRRPSPRAAGAAARCSSASVFHSPQPAQRPCHFGS